MKRTLVRFSIYANFVLAITFVIVSALFLFQTQDYKAAYEAEAARRDEAAAKSKEKRSVGLPSFVPMERLVEWSRTMDRVEEQIDRYRHRANKDRTELERLRKLRIEARHESELATRRLARSDRTIHQLERELEKARGDLIAKGVVSGRRPLERHPLDPRAMVLRFDHPSKLIMINQGSIDGVKLGDKLDLVRGSTYVGTIIIDRVEQTTSIGHLSVKTKHKPRAGDRVMKL